jgi:hypothetical protein
MMFLSLGGHWQCDSSLRGLCVFFPNILYINLLLLINNVKVLIKWLTLPISLSFWDKWWFNMVSELSSLDDDGHFPSDVEHVFGQSYHTWKDMLKCLTSPRDTWPWHFIRHGVSSSLNASFESANGPMNFSHSIRTRGFLRWYQWVLVVATRRHWRLYIGRRQWG